MSTKPKSLNQQLKELKQKRNYWYGVARQDTASLSRTLHKVAEVEARVRELERQIQEKK